MSETFAKNKTTLETSFKLLIGFSTFLKNWSDLLFLLQMADKLVTKMKNFEWQGTWDIPQQPQ